MKFIDLFSENKDSLKDDSYLEGLDQIEKSGKYLLGDYLKRFEESFSKDQDRKFCIGVKNATDAICIALRLLGCQEKTVVVPQFGAYPTVVAALQAGSKRIITSPVDETLTIDPKKLRAPKGSIIVPVNLFGNECDILAIREFANANDCLIVEDCAQSTGISTNSDSDISIHSFYPTKPLGCRGDGGAILTNSEEVRDLSERSRFYGLDSDGILNGWGFNSRLDEWQSNFLLSKISKYRDLNEIRRNNAKRYSISLNPTVRYTKNCVYHQYVTLWSNREKVQKKLQECGIPTMIHYPRMLNDMNYLLDKISFDNCPRVSDHILSIPVGPHLTPDDIDLISEKLYECKDESIEFSDISAA